MDTTVYLSDLFSSIQNCRITESHTSALGFQVGMDQVYSLIKGIKEQEKKIMFIGNGGSTAIASHMAIDYWRNGGIKAMCFNDASALTCISNDFGYASVFSRPIEMYSDKGDLLVAISSSGQSANILAAVDAASKKQCPVITLSGFKADNPLSTSGDYNIYVPSHNYGCVELAHQIILHYLVDRLVQEQGGPAL